MSIILSERIDNMDNNIDNNNFVNGDGVPLGFGMALAQNSAAMDYFSSLSENERASIITGTHNIRSKKDMQNYVQQIADRTQSGQNTNQYF